MERTLKFLLIVGIILFGIWALGFGTSYYLGGYIHVVLVIAIICFGVWFFMYFKGHRK